MARGSRLSNRPSSGAAIDQRQAGGEPVRDRLGGDREFERHARPSAAGRASRPRGRRRTAGRARAGSRAARRATGSPGRCAPAARGRGRRANGISVTTIRKNSTPISAPPPTRTASRMSRTSEGARSALMPALPARSSRGALEPDRPVRRGDDHARRRRDAARISSASTLLRRRVERRGRLVEQPDRPRHGDQPGERQPPPLPGRQIGRPAGRPARRARPPPSAASSDGRRRRDSAAQNCRFSRDRQRRLQRVLMAEIMGLLGDAWLPARRPSSASRPAGERAAGPAIRRSSEDLPAPLRPGHQQRLAAPTAKLEPGEHLAAAADAGEVGRLKPHQAAPRRRREAVPPRTTPICLRIRFETIPVCLACAAKKALISPPLRRTRANSRAEPHRRENASPGKALRPDAGATVPTGNGNRRHDLARQLSNAARPSRSAARPTPITACRSPRRTASRAFPGCRSR